MSWQYRIIAHPKVEEGEVIFKVHRLHISTSGRRYLDESIDLAFEEPHGLNDLLISIKQALKKPILWGDVDSDRFLTEEGQGLAGYRWCGPVLPRPEN